MKNFWILITVFCLCYSLFNRLSAQSDTLNLYQVYNSFSNSEKAEWTSFENSWNYFEYSKIQKYYKVSNLNCKKCSSFYADLYIKIDESGKVTFVHFISGKKCGVFCVEEIFIELFENSLKKQHFTDLKNKRFIARFGNVLKC